MEELDDDNIDTISASEDEDDDRRHSQLIDAITSLDKKRKLHKLSQRTVPAAEVSEFTFSASGDRGKVHLHELVGTLKHSASHGELKKQLQTVEKRNNVVKVPLPKREQEKVARSVAYESTTEELSKWDPVVHQNRKSEQLIFPLDQPTVALETSDQFVKRFKPRTPLEMEIAAVLKGSENVLTKERELTVAEEKALKAMSLEEAKERRAELMKYRALLSYKEEKARWQKKIKSKKYHRVMRKEKLKFEKKTLDEMQKNDPEGYTEKLEKLEGQRIQERMSLKHRGGSKFARKQMIYSKYDDQARQSVQDMLQKSRELTQKLNVESESDSDGNEGVAMDEEDLINMAESQMSSVSTADNPWMKMSKISKVGDYEKPAELSTENCREEQSDSENEKHEQIEDKQSNDSEDSESEISNKEKNSNINTIPNNAGGKAERKRKEKSEYNTVEDEVELSDSEQIDQMFSKMKEGGKPETKSKKKKKKKKKPKNDIDAKNILSKETDIAVSKESAEETQEDVFETMISEGLTRKRTLEEIGDAVSDEDDNDNDNLRHIGAARNKVQKRLNKNQENRTENSKGQEVYVDPKKLFKLESRIQETAAPDLVVNEDDEMEDGLSHEERQRMTIAQAFEDDDVIDEFSKEKGEIMERDKPKDIDLTLPGWGEWGGAGLAVSKRKRKRFIKKAPTGPPRKDEMLGNVIISEQKDKSISKYQVSDLPFPYTNVKQFERSIRAPIGKTWNPESAYKQLLKPKVVTKLGKIIAPIDKSEVFKKQKVKEEIDNTPKTDSGKHRRKKFKR